MLNESMSFKVSRWGAEIQLMLMPRLQADTWFLKYIGHVPDGIYVFQTGPDTLYFFYSSSRKLYFHLCFIHLHARKRKKKRLFLCCLSHGIHLCRSVKALTRPRRILLKLRVQIGFSPTTGVRSFSSWCSSKCKTNMTNVFLPAGTQNILLTLDFFFLFRNPHKSLICKLARGWMIWYCGNGEVTQQRVINCSSNMATQMGNALFWTLVLLSWLMFPSSSQTMCHPHSFTLPHFCTRSLSQLFTSSLSLILLEDKREKREGGGLRSENVRERGREEMKAKIQNWKIDHFSAGLLFFWLQTALNINW